MAVWLTEISKVGALDKHTAIGGDQTEIPHLDATVTSKTFAIGATGTLLATTTRAVMIEDDASTGFRFNMVEADDTALPSNSPVWLPTGGPRTWSVGYDPTKRYFKTEALE